MALVTLTLSKATQEQALELRKRTHVQWPQGLDIDQYLQRDVSLDNFEHAKGGKLTRWQAFFHVQISFNLVLIQY